MLMLSVMAKSIGSDVKDWFSRPQNRFALAMGMVALFLMVEPALAQAGGAEEMPWEGPLRMVTESLCGPVAQAAAVIAFVVTGLLVAFGELNGIFSVMMRVVFGLSVALFAINFMSFFGAADALPGC
ncbi:TrbC/VirB2 family protein [Thioalkalivibrio sp. ALE23]|uniref:TrbC/VirB2 family protein n=1 Tax=Thioalkalivibrio sp. ALE23 TaxID=1265495 RepID=UPI00037302E6|nr:TrbC/VirB2 family protein [Thioalkalivibrio sp. ALE23]